MQMTFKIVKSLMPIYISDCTIGNAKLEDNLEYKLDSRLYNT